jgi:dienelactone hydrolase
MKAKAATALVVLVVIAVWPTVRADADRRAPQILLSKPTVLFSQPVIIKITGLRPREEITVHDVADTLGTAPLSSTAVFHANSNGVVDLAHARSESGTYVGHDRTGLFWSLRPADPGPYPLFPEPLPRAETDQLSVEVGGTTLATRTLVRQLMAPGVTERQLRPDAAGFYGDYFAPIHPSGRPAVVVLGGSDGGLTRTSSLIAAQLASDGHPALALAYFHEPGLPPNLVNVPFEYFETALTWLARQPGINRHRILTMGASRGSEAALLLGVHDPDLVAGVIATSPSAVVNTDLPDVNQPAWTLQGTPLPFVPFGEFKQPNPTDVPDAVIPVEQIRGPILFVCGKDDHTWPSCDYVDAMTNRLAAGHKSSRPVVLRYAAGGHLVDQLVPNTPEWMTVGTSQQYGPYDRGGGPSVDAAARADAWPRLLAFLDRADRRT